MARRQRSSSASTADRRSLSPFALAAAAAAAVFTRKPWSFSSASSSSSPPSSTTATTTSSSSTNQLHVTPLFDSDDFHTDSWNCTLPLTGRRIGQRRRRNNNSSSGGSSSLEQQQAQPNTIVDAGYGSVASIRRGRLRLRKPLPLRPMTVHDPLDIYRSSMRFNSRNSEGSNVRALFSPNPPPPASHLLRLHPTPFRHVLFCRHHPPIRSPVFSFLSLSLPLPFLSISFCLFSLMFYFEIFSVNF